MSRYIETDAFEKAMYHEAFETDTDMQRWDSGCWIRYKLFENVLEQQPTADVRENVHGKWILVREDNRVKRRCSRCGWTQRYDEPKYQGYRYKFCPECGADMRGETIEQ